MQEEKKPEHIRVSLHQFLTFVSTEEPITEQHTHILSSYTLAPIHAALKGAIRYRDNRITDFLLSDPRVNPSFLDNEYLIQACMYGNIYAVRRLLSDTRVNVSARGNEAFHIAHSTEQWDILRLLSEHVGICTIRP